MHRTSPDWERHAARMADATVRPESRWHRPLATTARHLFVPRWWTWTHSEREGRWAYELHDGPSAPEAWMNSAYDRHTTLTTRVGRHHADHATPGTLIPETRPTSSSTLPRLVVEMYRHAVIADDSRTLVTCGSGYGTALACRRLGADRVTSVDVDPYLVQAARERLDAIGHRPRLEVCDVTGELPGSFDRIVSTVSVETIPASWLTALAPGGRLVTTLARTGLVIVADKTADGGATGQVAPEAAAFMSTRHGDDYPPGPDNTVLWTTARTAEGDSVTTGRYPVMRVNDAWDVRSTLELMVPGVEHRMDDSPGGARTAYMLHPDGSWARAAAAGPRDLPTVHQGGPRRLWDELDKIRTWLVIDGDLPVAGAAVTIDPDGTCHLNRSGWTATIGAR
ncbi:methyltransferase domain-containing protein [Streptomyces clavuligerus]|uniref:Protein-L-isoaspartate O-methyltransferase n=1 Tax=Streptomyces clavuligerus TaxID=1901 RepID=D5SIM1_STRCL|nr:methyltransferase domain-containing protein [Streptomyces clavuligerus]EFG03764.1 Putative O-methyltransferase [Streptomyces clavuligerus]MBY6307704.1 methyltransferase domain-containing protein [Streptomyces clavuligerus]QCS09749.1 methyltransferase domain-containing protein [Streptomyces clavuligerus]QPJ98206.1 methyltransferase domain-containing protein [Streptomyces clavuligerus]WDN56456.1 methyltransferase domain-containing protein [Streptomyces clavuligerus]